MSSRLSISPFTRFQSFMSLFSTWYHDTFVLKIWFFIDLCIIWFQLFWVYALCTPSSPLWYWIVALLFVVNNRLFQLYHWFDKFSRLSHHFLLLLWIDPGWNLGLLTALRRWDFVIYFRYFYITILLNWYLRWSFVHLLFMLTLLWYFVWFYWLCRTWLWELSLCLIWL